MIYEAGTDLGGTWRWNRYPGARVDSEVPEYQFSWPEVYKDWTWSTNYPNYEELRAYFDHVDKVLDIKKDCSFETVVTGAQFKTSEGKWHVNTADGRLAKAKYFIVAAGFVCIPRTCFSCHTLTSRSHLSIGIQTLHPAVQRSRKVQGCRSPLFFLARRRRRCQREANCCDRHGRLWSPNCPRMGTRSW